MLSYFNFLKLRRLDSLSLGMYPIRLHAYRLRFKTIAAPVRPCGVAKISKTGENLRKLNLCLRHQLSRVPKYI